VHNFCDTCTTSVKRAQVLGNVHSTTSLKRAHIEYLKRLGGGGETRYIYIYHIHMCDYICVMCYVLCVLCVTCCVLRCVYVHMHIYGWSRLGLNAMEKVGQVWIKLWPLHIEGINGWEGIRPSILWGFGRIYSVKLLTLWLGCLDFSPNWEMPIYVRKTTGWTSRGTALLRLFFGRFWWVWGYSSTSHGSWFMLRYVRRSTVRNWASGPCVLDDRPVVGQYVLLLVQKSRFWAWSTWLLGRPFNFILIAGWQWLRLVEIFQRCDAERARCGMMPFRYVVVLTKTDLCKSLGAFSGPLVSFGRNDVLWEPML